MRDLASVFSALADPTRLQMLSLLMRHEQLCVCDFVAALGITQSKASRHLRYLWNARLLVDERDGLWVRYRISPELTPDNEVLVKALRQVLRGRVADATDERLRAWLAAKATAPRPIPEGKAGSLGKPPKKERADRRPAVR